MYMKWVLGGYGYFYERFRGEVGNRVINTFTKYLYNNYCTYFSFQYEIIAYL